MTALALNPNRKLIAFSEYGDRPLVIIYDLENKKRRKILRCSEFKSHEVKIFTSRKQLNLTSQI